MRDETLMELGQVSLRLRKTIMTHFTILQNLELYLISIFLFLEGVLVRVHI